MSEQAFQMILQGGSFALLSYIVIYVTRYVVPAAKQEQKETRDAFERILDKKDAQAAANIKSLELAIRDNTIGLRDNTEAIRTVCKYREAGPP